jgi:hypothetical protein
MREDISKLLTARLNHESRATYCRAGGSPHGARAPAWRGGIGLDKIGNPAAPPKGLPPF